MKRSKDALKAEFHNLDVKACNGKLFNPDEIKRYVKLYTEHYKLKLSQYQLNAEELKDYRKYLKYKHFGGKQVFFDSLDS